MDQASVLEYLRRRDQGLVGPHVQEANALARYLRGDNTLWSSGGPNGQVYGDVGRFAGPREFDGKGYYPDASQPMANLDGPKMAQDQAMKMLYMPIRRSAQPPPAPELIGDPGPHMGQWQPNSILPNDPDRWGGGGHY